MGRGERQSRGLAGYFHVERLVRALVDCSRCEEVIEFGLLLQEISSLRVWWLSFFKVRCMRSWRPFC